MAAAGHSHPLPHPSHARHTRSPTTAHVVAFEEIYARHAAEVFRVALAVLRDAASAEDVTQEVFERLWSGSGYDARRGELSVYLRVTARSRALDVWRKTRAAERMHQRVAECTREPDESARPEAAVATAAQERTARAAVRRLPRAQRQAVGLAFWGGLSMQQVAKTEQIPLGTAKSRVRLGLRKLSLDFGVTVPEARALDLA